MSTVDPGRYYDRCSSLDESSRSYCREYIDRCVAQRATRGARDSTYELVSENGKSSTGLKFIDCIQLSPIHALHGKPKATESPADIKPLPKPDAKPTEGVRTSTGIDVAGLKRIYENYMTGLKILVNVCDKDILFDKKDISSSDECLEMHNLTFPLSFSFWVELQKIVVGKYKKDGSQVTKEEAENFCNFRSRSSIETEKQDTLHLVLEKMGSNMRNCISKVESELSNVKPSK